MTGESRPFEPTARKSLAAFTGTRIQQTDLHGIEACRLQALQRGFIGQGAPGAQVGIEVVFAGTLHQFG